MISSAAVLMLVTYFAAGTCCACRFNRGVSVSSNQACCKASIQHTAAVRALQPWWQLYAVCFSWCVEGMRLRIHPWPALLS
jgi:hypothetical protein